MSAQCIDLFRRFMATICCIFGLPGNILTIFISIKALYCRTINFERRVFDLYLAEISTLDTFLLLYWLIENMYHFLYSIGKANYFSLLQTSAFSCFFFFLSNRLFSALCSWLITCFTFIRFLNIFQPLNTIRSNIILLIILTITFSISNGYLVFTLKYVQTNENHMNDSSSNFSDHGIYRATPCRIHEKYRNDNLILLLNVIVAGFLNLVLPSTLTLIVNIAIVYYIKRAYRTSKTNLFRRGSNNVLLKYRSTRSTLLVISITYTLCYLPYSIIYLLLVKFDVRNEALEYLSQITFILRYISHSINFYAYIFTSQRFRRDIVSLFRSCSLSEKRKDRPINPPNRIIFRHYRIPHSGPTNGSTTRMIYKCQRPTFIRFKHQSDYARQENLHTSGMYVHKAKTVVAFVTPSTSFDKLRRCTKL